LIVLVSAVLHGGWFLLHKKPPAQHAPGALMQAIC